MNNEKKSFVHRFPDLFRYSVGKMLHEELLVNENTFGAVRHQATAGRVVNHTKHRLLQTLSINQIF